MIYSLFLLLAATTMQAQEYMTLHKARQMALKKSEDLKIAESTLDKSVYDQKAARTSYLPVISASATGIYLADDFGSEMYLPTYTADGVTGELQPNLILDQNGQPLVGSDGSQLFSLYAFLPLELSLKGAYLAGIKVEQAIFTGGKISSGNRMADIGVEMAKENLDIQRMRTIVEADKSYWLYVSVQSKVKLAETNLYMLGALLKGAQDSYDVGLAKRNEVLKVQVEFDKARLDLQKAQSGLELTRMSLCRVTGLDFATAIKTDSIRVVSDEFRQQTGDEDVTLRPEYRLLNKNIELEEKRISNVRSDYLPTIGLSAGYDYLGHVELSDNKINEGMVNVMANVKIPLFNWGEGRQKVAAAQVVKSIKEQELEKNKQLMQLEIRKAKLNLKDAALRIQISEDALLQAAENLRVSKDNYDVGRELMTDLLIAQTQWQRASSELIEAQTSYKLSETEYLRVTSQLLSGESTGK